MYCIVLYKCITESENTDEANQGWAAWAWSFVPQLTADSEGTEFADSGDQQSVKKVEQSVLDVGVYIMQASVVFKVCMCPLALTLSAIYILLHSRVSEYFV